MIYDSAPEKTSRQRTRFHRTMQNNSGGADTPPDEKLDRFSTMGSLTLDAPTVTSAREKTPVHYRITTEEVIGVANRLSGSEMKVLYYIRSLDPFGDRGASIGVREVGRILGLSAASVSRALKKLDAEGFIDVEILQARVRTRSKQAFPGDNVFHSRNECCTHETLVAPMKHSLHPCNDRPLEPAPEASPEPSHPIHTDQTLSLPPTPTLERAIEDEELTKYVMNRVKSDHSIRRPRAYAKRVIQNDRAYWEEEFLRHKNAPHEQRDSSVPAARGAVETDLMAQRLGTLQAMLDRGETDKVTRILEQNPDWGVRLEDITRGCAENDRTC